MGTERGLEGRSSIARFRVCVDFADTRRIFRARLVFIFTFFVWLAGVGVFSSTCTRLPSARELEQREPERGVVLGRSYRLQYIKFEANFSTRILLEICSMIVASSTLFLDEVQGAHARGDCEI